MAVDVEVSLNLGPLTRFLDRYPSEIDRQLRTAMEKSVAVLQADAAKGAPVDTGTLRASIQTDVHGAGLALEGVVRSPLGYASVMEFGRRAGARMPPTEPIARWAHRHGLPEGAAFAIARAIGRRGLKGHFFMRNAVQKNEGRIRDFFGDAVAVTLRIAAAG